MERGVVGSLQPTAEGVRAAASRTGPSKEADADGALVR